MRLQKFRVVGFQSFSDTGDLEFCEGINLIIGQNNAGKSALLRAMKQITDDRHRSPEAWDNIFIPTPEAHMSFIMGGRELMPFFVRHAGHHVPVPMGQDVSKYSHSFFEKENISISVKSNTNSFIGEYPSHGMFKSENDSESLCAKLFYQNGSFVCHAQFTKSDDIPIAVNNIWIEKAFYFSAERMKVGESSHSHANRLEPDASNLPAVLLTLSGDRGSIFRKLVGHLRQIFSTVGNISVRPRPGLNTIEIRVWPTEEMERVELSFPLNSSGTGVAQVIAILTAIMTSEDAVIIIDEINSFLHPAAVKALLRIIQTEYSHHQYIISTHAPEVVSFSNPSTIHLVKREGYESSVTALELKRVEEFRELADHLGVSMSDVFAADSVIWVEGPTEELCFPYLYEFRTGKPLPRATVFTSVSATGDFTTTRRDANLILDIYRRLTSAANPLKVAVAFSFDSEELSEAEKGDLRRASRNQMYFLPWRHIECYFISPAALRDFIETGDLGRDASQGELNVDVVASKLTDLASSQRFRIQSWNGNLFDAKWASEVDAAKLIANAVSDLTETRLEFRKKNDSLALLKLVQRHNPELIEPLSNYVLELVSAVSRRSDSNPISSMPPK
ncbi:ATP-dependent nuclease [Novosphingobium sp. UBA1939]|uniref:ATP-dependent nuclease n=1 Tax=Novosphingobium sp. UBA1939 TaxID=1946982 RepID=UPI0025EFE299|nr:AAA family ATPase [Novosphingobium sp. UBA1939]